MAPTEATLDDVRRAVRRLKAVTHELKSRDDREMFCLRLWGTGAMTALRRGEHGNALRAAREARAIADSYPAPADWARLSKRERARVTPERLGELRFRVSALLHYISRYTAPPARRRRSRPVARRLAGG